VISFHRFCRLLTGVLKLDLYNLNYEKSSILRYSLQPQLSSPPLASLPRKGIAVRIASFGFYFMASVWAQTRPSPRRVPCGAVHLFATCKNERDSLEPIATGWTEAFIVGNGSSVLNDFPLATSYLLSLPFLPVVVKHLLSARGFDRRSFSYNFDGYLHTYGLYLATRGWLTRMKPKCVVLSNQVATRHRVLVQAAREKAVPTVYVQHASVTESFPPLEFDYALLDGRDSLEKYARIGRSSTVVFLVGVTKQDAYFHSINHIRAVGSLGICTNPFDSLASIEELCVCLREAFPHLRLALRPHPYDRRRKLWEDLTHRLEIEFSDAAREHPMEFLRHLDVMIAGESNILLEAALLNVVPIYYDVEHRGLDYFGFARNGLAERLSDPAATVSYVGSIGNCRPFVRSRAKRYSATIGTRFDGKSGKLARGIIDRVVSGKPISSSLWRRIPGIDLTAYELAGVTTGEDNRQLRTADA
jgi:hypothetical protein